MMEAARTSETLVNVYQATRCYNQEDSNLQEYNCLVSPKDFECTLRQVSEAVIEQSFSMEIAEQLEIPTTFPTKERE
jgi:hypothetical protein